MNDKELFQYARDRRIPAGVQLRSKSPDLHAPLQWPAYFKHASGIEVWTIDGVRYADWSRHGIGATLLGYRDLEVTESVQRCIQEGSFSSLNAPEEVELADELCDLHSWASSARFTRSGGEAAAVAVRIARATTGRTKIAVCGYHGWHDWYLAANLGDDESTVPGPLPGLNPAGVPRELRGTVSTFSLNDWEGFDRIVAEHGNELACVVMEPCRFRDPESGFLEHVRERTHRIGALVVFDEITIGFRRCLGGSHLRLGVTPDMAVFAKSLGNGHPIAAIIGTDSAMSGARTSFISSTYWTERVGLVAALATIAKMRHVDVPAHLERIGGKVVSLWQRHITALGLPAFVVDGFLCFPTFRFDHELAKELQLLFVQEMLARGFLAGTCVYLTLTHTDESLAAYDIAVGEAFSAMRDAINSGDVRERLKGPLPDGGFRRLL